VQPIETILFLAQLPKEAEACPAAVDVEGISPNNYANVNAPLGLEISCPMAQGRQVK
jgi:hypothetical protein